MRVLDLATGTGLMAITAAGLVGSSGHVLGVDISEGMLVQARAKAEAAGLRNIVFAQGDAERLDIADAEFDRVVAASALVLMADIPATLQHWGGFLRPGGLVAFDAPAHPFGLGGVIAAVAAEHGLHLAYADVADTPERCRALVEAAGFAFVSTHRKVGATTPFALDKAVAFYDEHLDHPAWHALRRAPPAIVAAIRASYVARVAEMAQDGQVPAETALNFTVARKPG